MTLAVCGRARSTQVANVFDAVCVAERLPFTPACILALHTGRPRVLEMGVILSYMEDLNLWLPFAEADIKPLRMS